MRLRWLGGTALVALALGGAFVGQASTAGSGGWDHVGQGATAGSPSLNGKVEALNTDAPGKLLVGGEFTDAGGNILADRIASYDGVSWSPVGNASDQLTGIVHAIAYAPDGRIFAGGTFVDAGGNAGADRLAVWDGIDWKPFCSGSVSGVAPVGNVKALQIVGSTLYVGGEFQDWAGVGDADYLIACDLSTGISSPTLPQGKFFSGPVLALTADSQGVLYAGGRWNNLADNQAADNVAYFSGSAWHAMGSSAGPCLCALDGRVHSLTANGTDVYVGTEVVNVAGIVQADHVVRWNPAQGWSAVGSGAGGADGWFPSTAYIYALKTSGSKVYATGSFQEAGGDPTADNVAVFDGSAWHAVGSNGAGDGPWIGEGHALAIFPSTEPRRLYAGGSFTSAGGDTQARGIASFSIAGLTPTPTPTPTPVPTPVPTPTPMPQPTPTPTPTPDTTPPKITSIRLSNKVLRPAPFGSSVRAARARIGTIVSFTLSERGSVKFTVDRSTTGRTVKGKCVKTTGTNRSKPRCKRWVAVKGSFKVAGKKGLNKIDFRGRIGGRALSPGRYRLNARETDLAANTSLTRRTAFTVVR